MQDPAAAAPAANKCATPSCGKPSTLQCPQCKEKGLPAELSFFCSQQCFKNSWPMHKLFHNLDAKQLQQQSAEQKIGKVDPRFQGFKFTGALRPGVVSPIRQVPAHIPRPDYALSLTGESEAEKRLRQSTQILQHTPAQIAKARHAGRLAAEVLAIGAKMIKPGVTTDEIDRVVHEATIERNAYPSPLGYSGFPKSLCTSVNEIICHGIPDSRELENGDIVNLDVSIYVGGFHSDMNATFPVGEIDDASKLLINTTREALDLAIAACKPGMLYRDVGPIIHRHVTAQNLSVVRTYCGHGVGELFHAPPSIPHYNKNKAVGTMKPGHIFTIEPMINAGTWQDVLWPDDWTSATKDGMRSAQFEHTILITEDGHEVLTKL